MGSETGGDCSQVEPRTRGITSLHASDVSFAEFDVVVTWGTRSLDGTSRLVQEQLHVVRDVVATHTAFEALRADG